MLSDDRIVLRLSQIFTEHTERQVLDAVLLFLSQLGLADPAQLAPKLRARLAGIACDPSSLDAPPELIERIAEIFGAERIRSLERSRARLGVTVAARKDAPKPVAQRTSVVGILATKR